MTSAAPASDGGDLIRQLGDGPVLVADVELSEGLASLRRKIGEPVPGRTLFVLARLHTAPLGYLLLNDDAGEPERDWAAALTPAVCASVVEHLAGDGLTADLDGLWEGLGRDTAPACLDERRRTLESAPSVTVIIATRDRPERLRSCLDALCLLEYPNFDVVVVDNDPSSDETAAIMASRSAVESRLSYVRENQRGLAAAHNCGLRAAVGSIVALTDDDVIVDAHWLSELVAPFVSDARVAGASGLILPAELETPAQRMLEIHGRFGKGFEPRLYDLGANRPDDPLFPFAAGKLGSGANMAFDTAWLRSIGGFDPATGVGTTAKGGDDLLALFQVVASGRALAYRPGSLVWHHHHRDEASLRRQAYGYGVGLGAYLTSAVLHEPKMLLSMLRKVPAAVSYLRGQGDGPQIRPDHWPRSLTRLERRGLLYGPIAYGLSWARTRQSRYRHLAS
jgi:GT2 family glycosyltransferase